MIVSTSNQFEVASGSKGAIANSLMIPRWVQSVRNVKWYRSVLNSSLVMPSKRFRLRRLCKAQSPSPGTDFAPNFESPWVSTPQYSGELTVFHSWDGFVPPPFWTAGGTHVYSFSTDFLFSSWLLKISSSVGCCWTLSPCWGTAFFSSSKTSNSFSMADLSSNSGWSEMPRKRRIFSWRMMVSRVLVFFSTSHSDIWKCFPKQQFLVSSLLGKTSKWEICGKPCLKPYPLTMSPLLKAFLRASQSA